MNEVVASAPGRVNLIGEHLDYNGGLCLPIGLPQRTTARVAPASDGRVTIRSGDLEWTGEVGERPAGWAAYVVGVLDVLGVKEALEISITSEVPLGAGLSSSAALECSVATGVDALLGLSLSREEITAACIRAETEYVGAPTGGLDQTASVYAEPGQAVLLDFADGSHVQVGFDPSSADLSLLVVDTRVAHEHVDGGYAARRADCEHAARTLGVRHLTEVQDTASALTSLTEDRIRRRARHVFAEQQRVREFVSALELGDWAEAGALMTASHESLRDDFEVSCPELDAVVDAALGAGALGARMTGGGFGGSAIVLVDSGLLAGVRQAVDKAFAAQGWGAPAYFDAEPSEGARVDAG